MNYTLKLLIRNLVKRPILSLITFFGFTIGILASLLIYLWVFNELNHDKFHPDYDSIYRVLTLSNQGGEIVKSANSCHAIAETLKGREDAWGIGVGGSATWGMLPYFWSMALCARQ